MAGHIARGTRKRAGLQACAPAVRAAHRLRAVRLRLRLRYNDEYEDIRILHRSEHEIPPGLIERDFWVIGDSVVVRMHYGGSGRFEGADVADICATGRLSAYA